MSDYTVTRLTDTLFAKSLASFLNEYLSFGLCSLDYSVELIKRHKVYVVLNSDVVVATVVLYSSGSDYRVSHLAVAQELRGKGLGRSLLETLLYDNGNLPMHAVGWVTPNGWEAERIFLSCGFSISSTDQDYWRKDCKDVSFCPHYTDRCNCSATFAVRLPSDFPVDF